MSSFTQIGAQLEILSKDVTHFHEHISSLGSVLAVRNLVEEAMNICDMETHEERAESFELLSGAIARTLLDGCPLDGTEIGDRFLQVISQLENAI